MGTQWGVHRMENNNRKIRKQHATRSTRGWGWWLKGWSHGDGTTRTQRWGRGRGAAEELGWTPTEWGATEVLEGGASQARCRRRWMAKGSRGAARHRADKPPPTRILGERPTPTRETAPTRPRPGALRLRRLNNVSHRVSITYFFLLLFGNRAERPIQETRN